MSETTAANGAFIAPKLVTELLVKPLEAASVVLAASPVVIQSSAPVRIPRITGGPATAWVAEGGQIPEGDVATDEITALPSTLKSAKVIVRVTSELVRSSSVAVNPVFQERIVSAVANHLDTAFLTGNGASNTVRGLVNTVGASTAELDVTDADSLLDALAVAYADEVQPTHWFVSGADFIALRKLKDGNGRYLIESDVTKDVTYRLFGLPVVVTNKLGAGKALLVAMNHVVVVNDVNPSVQILTEKYADTDEIGIKVVYRADIAVTHPESVVVLTDVV